MTARKKASGAAAEKAADLSFEDALERLEGLVERLEEGDVPLEESLEAYAEGRRLVKQCLERLRRAETLIQELSEEENGFRLDPSALDAAGEDDVDTDQDELDF